MLFLQSFIFRVLFTVTASKFINGVKYFGEHHFREFLRFFCLSLDIVGFGACTHLGGKNF